MIRSLYERLQHSWSHHSNDTASILIPPVERSVKKQLIGRRGQQAGGAQGLIESLSSTQLSQTTMSLPLSLTERLTELATGVGFGCTSATNGNVDSEGSNNAGLTIQTVGLPRNNSETSLNNANNNNNNTNNNTNNMNNNNTNNNANNNTNNTNNNNTNIMNNNNTNNNMNNNNNNNMNNNTNNNNNNNNETALNSANSTASATTPTGYAINPVLHVPDNTATPHTTLQRAVRLHEQDQLQDAFRMYCTVAKKGQSIGLLLVGLSLRHGWGCAVDRQLASQCLYYSIKQACQEHSRLRLLFSKSTAASVSAIATNSNDIKSSSNNGSNGNINQNNSKRVINEESIKELVTLIRCELAMALYELGQCYRFGWGVSRPSKSTAVYYYRLASDLGDLDAQLDLAQCYANGFGARTDRNLAACYYRMAFTQRGRDEFGMSWVFKEKYTEYFAANFPGEHALEQKWLEKSKRKPGAVNSTTATGTGCGIANDTAASNRPSLDKLTESSGDGFVGCTDNAKSTVGLSMMTDSDGTKLSSSLQKLRSIYDRIQSSSQALSLPIPSPMGNDAGQDGVYSSSVPANSIVPTSDESK